MQSMSRVHTGEPSVVDAQAQLLLLPPQPTKTSLQTLFAVQASQDESSGSKIVARVATGDIGAVTFVFSRLR